MPQAMKSTCSHTLWYDPALCGATFKWIHCCIAASQAEQAARHDALQSSRQAHAEATEQLKAAEVRPAYLSLAESKNAARLPSCIQMPQGPVCVKFEHKDASTGPIDVHRL